MPATGAWKGPDDAESAPTFVVDNPWSQLRQFTAARIALGRTGDSLPTQPQLAFQLAHAQARDAVHLPLDVAQLANDLERLGVSPAQHCLQLDSAAHDRLTYLQRPDLGRRLNDTSREALQALAASPNLPPSHDLAFVVSDGLSALAVAQNAAPFLAAVMPHVRTANWSVAPVAIVRLGRVAVGDEVGQLLHCRVLVMLLGERPGLSSPDSMGIYVTFNPRVGLNDASRNCISNIRPAGLSYATAAFKLHFLITEMLRRQISGVHLKDDTEDQLGLSASPGASFFLGKPG